MKARAAVSGLTVGLAAAVGVATAAPPAAPSVAPAVGASATYRWTSTLKQTVPVLVQQPRPGGAVEWSITEESVSPEPIVVTYAVVGGDPKRYTLQLVTRARLEGPPLSVTQVTVDRASGKAVRSLVRGAKGPVSTADPGVKPLHEAQIQGGRREEVTVPAGRFTALRGAAEGAEVWVSDQVPVLGLVKAVWRDGTLELLSTAAGQAEDLFKKGAK